MSLKSQVKLIMALVFAAFLMTYPESSLLAAHEAMATFVQAYAPAMLPFFIILPVLSSPEAAALYESLFSWPMGALFGCPGRSAGAVILGVLAGSPAGSLALQRLSLDGSLDRGELSRAALLCTGLSPLFLISGVGLSMLGSAADGLILVRSQLGALILSGLTFRWFWRNDHEPLTALYIDPPGSPVRDAAINMITVCGYMVFFGVIARLTAELVGKQWEAPLLAFIEAAGGAKAITGLDLQHGAKVTLVALSSCMSGLSILTQNLSRLAPLGLPAHRLVMGKVYQGIIGALLCAVQMRTLPLRQASPVQAEAFVPQRAAIMAVVLLILIGGGIVLFKKADSQRE